MNPDPNADNPKPRAMKAFVFAVLVLVVFNLILFFKLVVAPPKGTNPAPTNSPVLAPPR